CCSNNWYSRDGQFICQLFRYFTYFLTWLNNILKNISRKIECMNDVLMPFFFIRVKKLCRGSDSSFCPFYSDRKSTRLNSSHVSISYAVFCLKKKKKNLLQHSLHH